MQQYALSSTLTQLDCDDTNYNAVTSNFDN